jgi:hypothetical protein
MDLKGRPFPKVPNSYEEAMASEYAPEWWAEMCGEIRGLLVKDAFVLEEASNDAFVLGGKWAYSLKIDPDGVLIGVKARWVVKGFKTLPYFERFGPKSAPLVPFPGLLLYFNLVSGKKYHVKTTDFVKGYVSASIRSITDEPVYVDQPQGFVNVDHPNLVCRLNKALYGHPHSGKAFMNEVSSHLGGAGFVTVSDDVLIFVGKNKEGEEIVFLSYVDDSLTAGSAQAVDNFLGDFRDVYDIDVRGSLNGSVFLGREIDYDESKGEIIIKQTGQIEKLVSLVDGKVHPAYIPITPGTKLRKFDGQATPKEINDYLTLVGHLLWVVPVRPDVAFPVGLASRFSSNPGPEHFDLVKRIIGYLVVTKDVGLKVGGDRKTDEGFVAYVDADFAGDKDDLKSTTGFVIFYNGSLVSFVSKKQSSVATSTAQAESVAVYLAMSEIEWLEKIASSLPFSTAPSIPILHNDNSTAVSNFNNPTYLEQTKNVDTKVRRVREQIEGGFVKVEWVKGVNNIADLLTKPLGRDDHRRHAQAIGLVGFPTVEEMKEGMKRSAGRSVGKEGGGELEG